MPLYSFFSQDYAAVSAQKENWKEAQSKLQPLVAAHHTDSVLLYDMGVASYKLKEYEAAEAYFKDAAQQDQVSVSLKEQAHFNLGNSYIQQKKLSEALSAYNDVLSINNSNEQAKHNKAIVEKMLEEKKRLIHKKTLALINAKNNPCFVASNLAFYFCILLYFFSC